MCILGGSAGCWGMMTWPLLAMHAASTATTHAYLDPAYMACLLPCSQ